MSPQAQPASPQAVLSWLRSQARAEADLCLDTRALRAGDVFFACPGYSGDGRRYLAQAAERGAAAIVLEAQDWLDQDAPAVPLLAVPGLRAMLGEVADAWYGRPSQALSVIAVTGTNGKRSEEHTSESSHSSPSRMPSSA